MDQVFFPEWRDEAGESKFPLTDAATLRSTSGMVLSSGWMLDASLTPVGGVSGTRLTRLVVATGQVTVEVGDDDSDTRAVGEFDPSDPPEGITLYDEAGRAAGLLVCSLDESAALAAWPLGAHRFPVGAAPFASGVCHPVPEGRVLGFELASGEIFSGNAILVGENGVVLREEDGFVRVDIVGDPLFRRAVCGNSDVFETPRFITSINGIPLGPDGSFRLAVGERAAQGSILRIYPNSGKLRVEAVGQSVGAI